MGRAVVLLQEIPSALHTSSMNSTRLTESQIETLLTSLAEALESGLGLLQYVQTSAAKAALPPGVARRLELSMQQGAPLSVAMGRLPGVSRAEVALLQAGERTGHIPEALKTLAKARQSRRTLRRNFLLGLIYPVLMICAAGCLLPLPLIVTDGVSAYLPWALPPVVATCVMVFYALFVLPRLAPDSPLRAMPGRVARRLPILGRAMERGAHGTFADILGQCIKAGLPIQSSLSTAILASDDRELQSHEETIQGSIREGSTLADGLGAAGVFGQKFLGRIAQGELTGKLDEVLPQVAKEERTYQKRAVATVTALMAGLILCVVLAAIGYGIIHGATSYFETLEENINSQTK